MNKYLPHHREEDEQGEPIYKSPLAMLMIIFMIGMLCWQCADSFDRTAENQERYYSKPVEVTYERPAAYRMQSPTPDQMEAYHHLMQIQEVRR